MALWERVTIVGADGSEYSLEAGIFDKPIEIKHNPKGVCIKRESAWGITDETVCVHQPEVSVNTTNKK